MTPHSPARPMPPDLAAELRRIEEGKANGTIPGNILECRKADADEDKRRAVRQKHEERLKQISRRISLDNLPSGFAGGAELRKRFRAYFECDKRFNSSAYQSVDIDRYTGLSTKRL